MRLCCTNVDCMRQNSYTEFEFDAPEKCPIDNVKWSDCEHAPWDMEVGLACPKCGSSEHLAPAWSKNYRFPRELEILNEIKELDARIEQLKKAR